LTTTRYYWDRGFIANETINGAHSATNFIGIGGIFGRRNFGPNGCSEQFMMLKNWRGDVVSLVNEGGLLWRYDYSAFGVERDVPGFGAAGADGNAGRAKPNNPFRFGHGYYDVESGLVYLRNRYYSPRIGRFITEDPYWGLHNMQNGIWAIRQSSNLFAFGMNNPIRFIDPSGLYCVDSLERLLAAQNVFARGGAVNEARARTMAAEARAAIAQDVYFVERRNPETFDFIYAIVNAGPEGNTPQQVRDAITLSRFARAETRRIALMGNLVQDAVVTTVLLPFVSSAGSGVSSVVATWMSVGAGLSNVAGDNASEPQITINNLPDGWTQTNNNGFIHVKDASGRTRIRIDPGANRHIHLYDAAGNSLDIHGNIVHYKSPEAHIPFP